ncbi:hypothetical protein pEaSNUABM35_00239 [Erwinia phage pEa_SNUABM_35]|uniref:RecA family profile 2 domain-containing protein n=1 Tax=Erwinia phage pEa_SNUABM_35 TaxID=2869557 RepID=A0AAE7XPD0_9CAUD|nr:UvsX-like recombinase [Erwinia phage pEa_SNUABM_35]QZE60156.1 hypothetical protein pEaSNUABM35_00239 [Erwinia phage pEa_SNUABM_35]QZE60492.1 hypothetical protein pEaSNUABM36_00239 [Erwinia phage pEa_SNUABM_36]
MAKANNKAEKKAEKKAKVKAKKGKAEAVASDDVGGVELLGFDLASLMDDVLDGIEKKTKVSSQDAARHAPRISTGCLALDMYLSGGIVPGGWYTFSGGEQSCKSTMTMSIMASLIRLKYSGISVVFDYEGSTDAEYVAGQLKTFGVKVDPKTIFGVRDDKDGSWIVKPQIRYYAPDNGERFFDYMSMLRRRLPDKIVEKDGTAYYIFENNKENAKKVAGKYDKKWFSRNNQFKVPANDGHMQAMVIVDSYPAMMPDQVDDDDGSKAMALQARMFSDGIKRFRGGMRRKMMTIVGVNQLRQKPAVMFGSPEYEPGGDALKFYCFDKDTLIRTDHGVLTAPQIKALLDAGTEVSVESFDGYQKINGAWLVDDAPFPFELNAGGHVYVGSAEHRQFTLMHDLTAEGTPVLRPEWNTLNQLAQHPEAQGQYAALRVPPVKELKEKVPDAFDEASQLVRNLLGNCDPVSKQLPLVTQGETTYAANCLFIDMVGEDTDTGSFSFWVEKLLAIGIYAYADETGIWIPGLNKHELEAAVEQDELGAFAGISFEATCRQRQTQMLTVIVDHFPELVRYVLDYQLQTGEDKIYLAPENDFAQALDLILHKEIAGYDDMYDLLMFQLAYVDDWYNFDSAILPVPFTLRALDEQREFWDVNVEETAVVITNGFVSHNSDVRVRLASRAVPEGWPKLKDAPGIVGEKSVTVEGGTDRYRFIAAKTIKNKMGGIPNQQTWLRLWEADGNGEARGFDPVFDTWHYLKTLGLVNGTRKSFKLKAPCPLASDVKMDWDDFRTLINGSKEQVVGVCKKLKVKPSGLRLWCFKFVQSVKGNDMLKAAISRSAKKSDDDDGDDE